MDNISFYIEKAKELLIQFGPKIIAAILLLIVGLWVIKFIKRSIYKTLDNRGMDESLKKFLGNLIGWALKIILLIAVLSQIGIESTSFIAVLGAAGLAIGLALQGSLANFAGGVLIMLFKPYKIGDTIEAQGEIGTVKEIEIFTTKIISPQNKLVIIPNGAMSNGNIKNYTALGTMQVRYTVGVSYNADIKQTKDVLMSVLTSQEKVLLDPPPVVMVEALADSSVNFTMRPWTKSEDFWPVHFATIENTKLALDAAGIEIPYPHQVEIRKKG